MSLTPGIVANHIHPPQDTELCYTAEVVQEWLQEQNNMSEVWICFIKSQSSISRTLVKVLACTILVVRQQIVDEKGFAKL